MISKGFSLSLREGRHYREEELSDFLPKRLLSFSACSDSLMNKNWTLQYYSSEDNSNRWLFHVLDNEFYFYITENDTIIWEQGPYPFYLSDTIDENFLQDKTGSISGKYLIIYDPDSGQTGKMILYQCGDTHLELATCSSPSRPFYLLNNVESLPKESNFSSITRRTRKPSLPDLPGSSVILGENNTFLIRPGELYLDDSSEDFSEVNAQYIKRAQITNKYLIANLSSTDNVVCVFSYGKNCKAERILSAGQKGTESGKDDIPYYLSDTPDVLFDVSKITNKRGRYIVEKKNESSNETIVYCVWKTSNNNIRFSPVDKPETHLDFEIRKQPFQIDKEREIRILIM